MTACSIRPAPALVPASEGVSLLIRAAVPLSCRFRLRERLRRGEHGPFGAVLLALWLLLAAAGVEPVPVWFYPGAWYPALLVIDAWTLRLRGTSLLVDRPWAVAALVGWSVPFWLLFEAVNLRIENWYYVNAPPSLLGGRVLLVLSFATVLPGIVFIAELLRAWDGFERVRTRPFRARAPLRRGIVLAGVVALGLTLVLPGSCYPFAWGFLVLLLAPFNRRPGWPSLLKDLERGRPGRLLRLGAAGLLCGAYWELMNLPARTRWIYTVPFFDRTLGVEMPPLGFIGFIPFALEAYAFLRALEILGLSAPFEAEARGPTVRLPVAVRFGWIPGLLGLLSFAVILGFEQRTIASRDPLVEDLPSAGPRTAAVAALEGAERVASFLQEHGDAGPEALATLLDVPAGTATRLLDEARLAALRGIGTANVALLQRVGVATIAELARREPEALCRALDHLEPSPAADLQLRHVRVWIRGARACELLPDG